jgi:hypothetical protein
LLTTPTGTLALKEGEPVFTTPFAAAASGAAVVVGRTSIITATGVGRGVRIAEGSSNPGGASKEFATENRHRSSQISSRRGFDTRGSEW